MIPEGPLYVNPRSLLISTLVYSVNVQLWMTERGLESPIPETGYIGIGLGLNALRSRFQALAGVYQQWHLIATT